MLRKGGSYTQMELTLLAGTARAGASATAQLTAAARRACRDSLHVTEARSLVPDMLVSCCVEWRDLREDSKQKIGVAASIHQQAICSRAC